jgi:exosortase C (VPDSG-CTERM-specific)
MNISNKGLELSNEPASNMRLSYSLVLGFLLVCVLPFVLAWNLVGPLFTLVRTSDTFSEIPLIPLVSLFIVYENRKAIFSDVSFGRTLGAAFIVPGTILLVVGRLNLWQLSSTNRVSLLVLAIVLVWVGAFTLFFGNRAFRVACFPLFFLLFMVPIPEPLLSKIIVLLQTGSADMTELFFRLAGVPNHRQGLVFELPGVAIRVAEECSGIHSTLALLITTALASYIFLKTSWKRLVLCLAVVPIAIFKNGLRIATLSALSIYVNPAFLTGNLHHHGGIVFFIIALVPMAILLRLLQKNENKLLPAAGDV